MNHVSNRVYEQAEEFALEVVKEMRTRHGCEDTEETPIEQDESYCQLYLDAKAAFLEDQYITVKSFLNRSRNEMDVYDRITTGEHSLSDCFPSSENENY